MTTFDEARAIKAMLDMRGISRNELSKNLNVSKSYIANKLRLLKLNEEVQTEAINHRLSERHIRLLLRISDKESQLEMINEISKRQLSVAEAEAFVEIHYLENISKSVKNDNGLTKSEAKEKFIENIKKGTNTLTSIGVSAKSTVTQHGKKSYIIIVID